MNDVFGEEFEAAIEAINNKYPLENVSADLKPVNKRMQNILDCVYEVSSSDIIEWIQICK